MGRLDLELITCIVVPDMKLSPNVGSDRSWVWNAAADVSEGEPEAQTLAIRFANSESRFSCHWRGFKIDTNHYFRRKPFQGGVHQGSTGERGSVQRGRLIGFHGNGTFEHLWI